MGFLSRITTITGLILLSHAYDTIDIPFHPTLITSILTSIYKTEATPHTNKPSSPATPATHPLPAADPPSRTTSQSKPSSRWSSSQSAWSSARKSSNRLVGACGRARLRRRAGRGIRSDGWRRGLGLLIFGLVFLSFLFSFFFFFFFLAEMGLDLMTGNW